MKPPRAPAPPHEHCPPIRRAHLVQMALLVLLLSGCGAWGTAAATATPGAPQPLATPEPTRGALASMAASPAGAAPPPSATPDPARLPEQFAIPAIGLTLRYPTGWTTTERSSGGEWLVVAQSPSEDPAPGLLSVNVQHVGGALTMAQLYPFAADYLRNLFGAEPEALGAQYREENGALLVTVVREREGVPYQQELRFAARPPFVQVVMLLARQNDWANAAPLLDEMARSISVVAPSEGMALASATPSTAARLSEGLTLQQGRLFRASTGSLYLVGLVRNESGQPLEDVQISATLLDASGSPLATTRWGIARRLLPPGESSPALLIFDPSVPEPSDFRVQVDGLAASPFAARVSSRFAVNDVLGERPALGLYALTGTLANQGEAARFVEVTGTLYDAAGAILAVETVELEQDVLEAGQSVPFRVTFFSKAEGEVARYDLLVEGIGLGPGE